MAGAEAVGVARGEGAGELGCLLVRAESQSSDLRQIVHTLQSGPSLVSSTYLVSSSPRALASKAPAKGSIAYPLTHRLSTLAATRGRLPCSAGDHNVR
jgi:hypothetical protein